MEIVRILPCFQKEMMVQEKTTRLEKTMTRSRKNRSRWSRL